MATNNDTMTQKEIDNIDRVYSQWAASNSGLDFRTYFRAVQLNDSISQVDRFRRAVKMINARNLVG